MATAASPASTLPMAGGNVPAAANGAHNHRNYPGSSTSTASAVNGGLTAESGGKLPPKSSAEGATPPPGVISASASVGHDHWANEVLSAVQPESSSSGGTAESDGAKVNGGKTAEKPVKQETPSAKAATKPPVASTPAGRVAQVIATKKRQFHSGRFLELKNLPDGCTEQVGTRFYFLNKC